MTTLLTETFTGTDGSPWGSQWVDPGSSAGAAATIIANRGRLDPGNSVYAGNVGRYVAGLSTANVDITGTFIYGPNLDQRLEVWCRTDTSGAQSNGYYLSVVWGSTMYLRKNVAGAQTDLASVALAAALVAGTAYSFRLRVVGNALSGSVWTGTEPSTPQMSASDSVITAAGAVVLYNFAGGTAHGLVDVDNVTITDGGGVNTAPTAKITSAAQSVTVGTPVTLTATDAAPGGTVASRLWSWVSFPGSGAAPAITGATTQSASFTPTIPGAYVSRYVVTDNTGLTSSPVTITTTATSDPVIVYPSAVAAGGSALVVGATGPLSVITPPVQSAIKYLETPAGGGQYPLITFPQMPVGALTLIISGYSHNGALVRTAKLFKTDGTTQVGATFSFPLVAETDAETQWNVDVSSIPLSTDRAALKLQLTDAMGATP